MEYDAVHTNCLRGLPVRTHAGWGAVAPDVLRRRLVHADVVGAINMPMERARP